MCKQIPDILLAKQSFIYIWTNVLIFVIVITISLPPPPPFCPPLCLVNSEFGDIVIVDSISGPSSPSIYSVEIGQVLKREQDELSLDMGSRMGTLYPC